MNKFAQILFLSIILNSFVILHSMEVAVLTQQHIERFLNIVNTYRPFQEAVPHIKQLATENQEWQKIFDDSKAMGTLIECACENYEEDKSFLVKVDMATDLKTKGSSLWGIDYLKNFLSNKVQKKILIKEFLRAAEEDNRKRMFVLLNIGIDINCTDQEPDGCYEQITCYQPALISAVKQLNCDLTTFLLEKNANPNIISSKKRTPLMIIIKKLYKAEQNKEYENFYKSFAILRLLLQHSALQISQIDISEKQAIDYATEYKMNWLQVVLCLSETQSCVLL